MGPVAARRMGCVFVLVAALTGCASGPVLRGGVYRDRAQGFAVAAPPAGWERVAVEDASLAFRGPEHASMALTSHCGAASADVAILARQLRIGLGPHELTAERTLELAGRPALLQWLTLAAAHVKTVTRAAAPCVQDFVLVVPHGSTEPDSRVASRRRAASPQGLDAAERVFDAWWASFVPGPERAP